MQSITILQGILHSRRYQTHEQAVKTCSVHTCAHTRVLMVCVYAPVYVMHAYVYPLKNAAGKTKNEKRKTKNEKPSSSPSRGQGSHDRSCGTPTSWRSRSSSSSSSVMMRWTSICLEIDLKSSSVGNTIVRNCMVKL